MIGQVSDPGKPAPLPPPPDDVVNLYRAYLNAVDAFNAVQKQLPQPYYYLTAGEPWPHEQLAEAEHLAKERTRAAVALYSHPWWRCAFDRDEAQRALKAALKDR